MGLGSCLLLLPLIGTGLAQVSISAAADTDKAHSAWSWKMPDQRSLGICLHMYLERDFPAIERIVYPGGAGASPATGSATPAPVPRGSGPGSRVILNDGPIVEANCRQLYRLVGCFSRSLGRMQYYENFSEFRRLVEAMDAVLRELCGAVELMRHRFVPLLQTLDCIERVREGSSCPYRDRLPPHIWHQLIRLEADSSLCWPLKRQLDCVRDSGGVRQRCGETAQHLFANLSSVFLGHWCLNSGTRLSQMPFILRAFFTLLPVLPVISQITRQGSLIR